MTVRQTRIDRETNRVKPTPVDLFERLSFSFKFLKRATKFNYSNREPKYYIKLIERLKVLSDYKASELKKSIDKELRFHPINWSRASEKSFGIPKEDEIAGEPHQFNISKDAHGRVHGFLIGAIFYIVWFDPGHKLFP